MSPLVDLSSILKSTASIYSRLYIALPLTYGQPLLINVMEKKNYFIWRNIFIEIEGLIHIDFYL